ncbi:hydrolase [Bremerella cremea]|uniref:hydrolase n=1 Tax=Bremerella cremea TaxID=1031537 RepID=UPI0031E4FB3D
MALESEVQPILSWLQNQQPAMESNLATWAAINSGTHNLNGLYQLIELVLEELAGICEEVHTQNVSPRTMVDAHGDLQEQLIAPGLIGICRASSPHQAILAIHLDTVYPADSLFQRVRVEADQMHGPGVADAKGGVVVLLTALKAFERYVATSGNNLLGWRVVLNCDEEIGSPGSAELFRQYAIGADFGLLFEPSLPNGHLVGVRKGSGNFEIVVRGQSAHAGREFSKGRNAIVAAARLAQTLHDLNGHWPETTINVAKIDGGGPSNVVPDTAVVRFNIRYPTEEVERQFAEELALLIRFPDEGITLALHGGFFAPPKPMTTEQEELLRTVQSCGKTLGLDLAWESTGGVCDGNRLAALGVPNVDTMGVQGGNIHSPQEYMLRDSLVERSQLTFLTLVTMAERFRQADLQ